MGIIAGSIVLIDVPWPELPERPLESLEVFESFFPDGSLEQRFHYYFEDGEVARSGPYETFYPDGAPKERGSYFADQSTGPYATFYASGEMQEEGVVWHGQLHGIVRNWDQSGNLISEDDYLVGERVPELRAHTASP
jgi:antitoxin component YwqK of YwqJK toxin-antitoxin module